MGCGWGVVRDIHESLILGEGVEEVVGEEGEEIWNEGDEDHELCVFSRRPGSLQIASTVEEGGARDDEAQRVLLGQGGCEEDPGIEYRGAGDDCEVWGIVNSAVELRRLVRGPGPISGAGIEEGEDDEGDDEAAGQRGDVEQTRCHVGSCRWLVVVLLVDGDVDGRWRSRDVNPLLHQTRIGTWENQLIFGSSHIHCSACPCLVALVSVGFCPQYKGTL